MEGLWNPSPAWSFVYIHIIFSWILYLTIVGISSSSYFKPIILPFLSEARNFIFGICGDVYQLTISFNGLLLFHYFLFKERMERIKGLFFLVVLNNIFFNLLQKMFSIGQNFITLFFCDGLCVGIISNIPCPKSISQ